MADITPAQRTWRTFKRNKLALGALTFIGFSVLIAILGYLVMPDATPNANNMSLPLSLKKPGSEFMLLKIRKSDPVDTVSFFHKLFFGQPDFYSEIPITNYRFVQDSIIVDEYIGQEDKPERNAYNIFEVITGKKPLYSKNEVTVFFPNGKRTIAATGEIYKRFYGGIYENQIVWKHFWLGTDIYGRDLLSRLILGARISLSVGIMAVIISLFLGIVIGAAAGYFGGWIDASLSWLMNILWSLPALLLVIAISFALGKGLWQIYIAVGH